MATLDRGVASRDRTCETQPKIEYFDYELDIFPNDKECTFCQKCPRPGERWLVLVCGHYHHARCISEYIFEDMNPNVLDVFDQDMTLQSSAYNQDGCPNCHASIDMRQLTERHLTKAVKHRNHLGRVVERIRTIHGTREDYKDKVNPFTSETEPPTANNTIYATNTIVDKAILVQVRCPNYLGNFEKKFPILYIWMAHDEVMRPTCEAFQKVRYGDIYSCTEWDPQPLFRYDDKDIDWDWKVSKAGLVHGATMDSKVKF